MAATVHQQKSVVAKMETVATTYSAQFPSLWLFDEAVDDNNETKTSTPLE